MLWYFIISLSTITIEPNIIPPKIAFFIATRAPERKASNPPVAAPATIWFNGPSSPLAAIIAQSAAEKSPAQSAKLPKSKNNYLQARVLFFWEDLSHQ